MADLARIKNNVAKMAAQGAPEQDIDGYIASEGVTVDDVRNFRASQPATESQQSVDLRGELSAMTQNPARGQYEMLPAWQKPIVAGSDILQTFANGATMGFGDKAVAGARSLALGTEYGNELAEARRQTTGARNRAGGAGLASEISGAIAAPVALAGKGLTLAGRGGTAAMTGGKGLAARSALMGAEGAGYGAVTAAGNDQDIGTGAMLGAASGVGGNILGEGISAGVGKVAGAFNAKPPPPMGQAKLEANKNAAYQLAERAGVIIKPEGMKHLQDNMIADIAEFGYDEVLHPGAKKLVDSIAKAQGQNLTLKGLDTIRKQAGNVGYIQGNKSNNTVVNKIVKHIEDLEQSGDSSLIEGLDTVVGQKAIKLARQYAHRSFKMEKANNLILKGNQMADRNITDTRVKSVKSQLAKINDPFSSWGRGFTVAEKEAAAKASKYTPAQRALHGASVLNPFGGGKLSAAGHLAAGAANLATGNLPGLALQAAGGVAGAGFQKAGEALANKSVREFVDLVARGGVPAPVVQNALQRLAHAKREAVSRALMAVGAWGAGTQQVGQQ
jgi:hypothetical protein